mgnify:CR=1 FL=1
MNTNLSTSPTYAIAESRSVSTQAMVFDPETLANMQRMAEAMATARITVPKHLAGSPGDCLAIVMQAAQWQMNPFAVAQKTHVVNGALGYEAQLVNAVVSASSLLATRIQYAFEGDWKGCNGKADKSEERAVVVSATLVNEQQPRTLRVSMAQVGEVRNSPLWVADPRQQLAYLATKRWARLHTPDVVLGVYSVDELQDHAIERPMGPAEVIPSQPTTSRTESIKAKLAARHTPPVDTGPDLATTLKIIEDAFTAEEMEQAAAVAKQLKSASDKDAARKAFASRKAALKEMAEAEAKAEREAIQAEGEMTTEQWQA